MNSTEQIYVSPKFGTVHVYTEDRDGKDRSELTVYLKTPENHYRFYRREFNEWDKWEATEVDWSGYILGAHSIRQDYEVPRDTWHASDDKARRAWVDELIQKDFDDDNIGTYHVERITIPAEWKDKGDKELWALEHELRKRKSELELELREVNRQFNMIWYYGGEKWDWGDRL